MKFHSQEAKYCAIKTLYQNACGVAYCDSESYNLENVLQCVSIQQVYHITEEFLFG